MDDLAIRCEGLSKRYRVGRRERYRSLRDSLARAARSPFGLARAALTGSDARRGDGGGDTVWALRDVSFDVKRGEVVGIIGRNGAGKSTLLKVLSRITRPTAGRAQVSGRVGSLLEVGTGFHPELTGRENIYLNGSILGMRRAEVARKFDEIVAFAETEKFIDAPVKQYSSGMYMRLAFSVAVHLKPEILLVDEVLSVGDSAFQNKCLTMMGDIAREGRTVLFVSHSLGALQTLCTRGVLLQHGSVAADGAIGEAVTAYLASLEGAVSQSLAQRTDRRGDGSARITKIEVSTRGGHASNTLIVGQPGRFMFHVTEVKPGMTCSFTVYDQHGQPVTYFDSALSGRDDLTDPEPAGRFLCEVPEVPLIPGRYRLNAALYRNGELQDHVEAAALLEVEQGELGGRLVPRDTGYGNVFMHHRWITPPAAGRD